MPRICVKGHFAEKVRRNIVRTNTQSIRVRLHHNWTTVWCVTRQQRETGAEMEPVQIADPATRPPP